MLAIVAAVLLAGEPQTILLWPQGAPGAVGNEDADRPSLTVFLPPAERAVPTGVIVCPGGGYAKLAMDHEGRQVAQWLNSLGVAAFVLKYRHAPRYRHPAPLQDAKRALRIVRARAAGFRIAADRIGVWGFSAGGHLASTLGTHFDDGDPGAADPIERAGCRPDFLVLAYPVITFVEEAIVHKGSRGNLLGDRPDAALLESLSTDKQVTPRTPPTFLFHTHEDRSVPAENSILFYSALRRAGVPAELHIYERGRHGVGLAPEDPVLSSWPARLADWLRVRGLLSR
ncbi:MAG: alpha/beta hydrolase [Bryobacterales bacterium]|nr:alpha/beta hydrolase [Bryobacteraceae bacterium]MDW8129538.1 alpha/beta hydrolase [Bryobacterales bacterium]